MAKKRSRRPLTLKLLEHAGPLVPVNQWPIPSHPFDRMSVGLKSAVESAVMDATWDSASLEDWQWDYYNKKFDFYVSSVMRLGDKPQNRPVITKSRFAFDPSKTWIAELDRVFAAVKEYSDSMLYMQRAYYAARKTGDVTSQAADED